MPALRSPEDVLATELKEIHSAERQFLRAIPRVAKKATSERLREMLDQRREQGAALIEEIDEALEALQAPKARIKNVAAEGLLEDMNQLVDEVEEEKLLDPVLLASVQKIEHYCIASWGTARSMGQLLGEESVVKTMERVIDEAKRFDKELTKLAEEEVNPQMLTDTEEDEEADAGQERGGGRRRARSKSR